MRYAVVNLGQASAPERFVPSAAVDCSNLPEYRKALDNAAARIAYYQSEMQAAVGAGNQGGIDAAQSGSDQANKDWQAAQQAIKKCEVPAAAAAAAAPASRDWTFIAIGVLAVGIGLGWISSKGRLIEALVNPSKKKGR